MMIEEVTLLNFSQDREKVMEEMMHVVRGVLALRSHTSEVDAIVLPASQIAVVIAIPSCLSLNAISPGIPGHSLPPPKLSPPSRPFLPLGLHAYPLHAVW